MRKFSEQNDSLTQNKDLRKFWEKNVLYNKIRIWENLVKAWPYQNVQYANKAKETKYKFKILY